MPVLDLIKCKYLEQDFGGIKYYVIPAEPCKGILYVTGDNPEFMSGHIRVRGKDDGRYPYNYLEMIDAIFGKEPDTIEVCARTVKPDKVRTAFTVDLNPDFQPSKVTDGQTLAGIESNRFSRWRSDPPYNMDTAKNMYNGTLPSFIKMLYAGARVCKIGSLLFLLLGPTNYQFCPPGVKRIGLVYISVIPNNETRALNIYQKVEDVLPNGYNETLG